MQQRTIPLISIKIKITIKKQNLVYSMQIQTLYPIYALVPSK